jgi:hypothetical protein
MRATSSVRSNDPEESIIDIPLSGFGVSYEAQAMALLSFFDDLVARGDRVGISTTSIASLIVMARGEFSLAQRGREVGGGTEGEIGHEALD